MTLPQYLEQFNSQIDVIVHYGREVGLEPKLYQDELADLTGDVFDPDENYTNDQKILAKKQAKDRFLACMFINGADKARFGDLHDDLLNDFAKGQRNYPTSVVDAYSLLVNYKPRFKPGNTTVSGSSFVQPGDEKKGDSEQEIRCWGCDKPGIYLEKCTKAECIKKWADKQERKAAKANEQQTGAQHLNVGGVDFSGDQVKDFGLDNTSW